MLQIQKGSNNFSSIVNTSTKSNKKKSKKMILTLDLNRHSVTRLRQQRRQALGHSTKRTHLIVPK